MSTSFQVKIISEFLREHEPILGRAISTVAFFFGGEVYTTPYYASWVDSSDWDKEAALCINNYSSQIAKGKDEFSFINHLRGQKYEQIKNYAVLDLNNIEKPDDLIRTLNEWLSIHEMTQIGKEKSCVAFHKFVMEIIKKANIVNPCGILIPFSIEEFINNNNCQRCEFVWFIIASAEKGYVLNSEFKSQAKLKVRSAVANEFLKVQRKAIEHSKNATIQHARNAAIAAIMSRNMSHNLGSHALANAKFMKSVGLLDRLADYSATKDEIAKARQRLQSFNHYCQGRMDFIARKLSADGDKPEPLLFINDLLKGFLSQKVLLDTLLDDNGFTTDNIVFILTLNDKTEKWGYDDDPEDLSSKKMKRLKIASWDSCVDESDGSDTLIGIAGGVTGCHAIFAFIENLLRNAAKYRRGNANQLSVHVELRDYIDVSGKDCYMLRIWDSLTDDQVKDLNLGEVIKGGIAATVRHALTQDIIDKDGKPITGGHGIQEMKLCAEYLAAKELKFPSDKLLCAEENINSLAKDVDTTYIEYLRSELRETENLEKMDQVTKKTYRQNKKAFELLTTPNLRAYSSAAFSEGKNTLVYEMLLPKPVLLGLTCVKNGGHCRTCETNHPNVRRYNNLEALANGNAYFGIILARDDNPQTIRYTLDEVTKLHAALPYRLMIVTPKEESCLEWETAVNNRQASSKKHYSLLSAESVGKDHHDQSATIPNRRIHVITYSDFFCDNGESENLQNVGRNKNKPWETHIINLYGEWIKVWKAAENGKNTSVPWNVWIGFERGHEQVMNKWNAPLAAFTCPLMNVHVVAVQNNTSVWHSGSGNKESKLVEGNEADRLRNWFSRQINESPNSALIFDNHSKCFPYVESGSVRFYHEFGANQLGLFQMLETPPSSLFGFAFFMYSLLEGCLTNVVVFDERVSEATISDSYLCLAPLDILGRLEKTGIIPIYSFSSSSTVDYDAFISPNIVGALRKFKTKSPEAHDVLVASEGFRFQGDSGVTLKAIQPVGNQANGSNILKPINNADIVIIHEGITDTLVKRGLWKSKESHRRLYNIVPAVVRTSGRGQQTRELGDDLPFIELSVLSDSCYGSMNKIKLARAVLNASGEFCKEDSK